MHAIVAGDDPIARQVLSRMLARFGSVDEVNDGEEALAALETALSWGAPPDLICLDASSPGPPGLGAVEGIRSLEECLSPRGAKRAKVLMIASARDGASAQGAFGAQVDGCLSRPILAAHLNEQLQRLGLI